MPMCQPGFQIDDTEPGERGNLWNFGMAFIAEAVSSMRLTAQMLQKLLLEGILDQVLYCTLFQGYQM